MFEPSSIKTIAIRFGFACCSFNDISFDFLATKCHKQPNRIKFVAREESLKIASFPWTCGNSRVPLSGWRNRSLPKRIIRKNAISAFDSSTPADNRTTTRKVNGAIKLASCFLAFQSRTSLAFMEVYLNSPSHERRPINYANVKDALNAEAGKAVWIN